FGGCWTVRARGDSADSEWVVPRIGAAFQLQHAADVSRELLCAASAARARGRTGWRSLPCAGWHTGTAGDGGTPARVAARGVGSTTAVVAGTCRACRYRLCTAGEAQADESRCGGRKCLPHVSVRSLGAVRPAGYPCDNMSAAIRIYENGGPEVLRLE